MKTHGFTRNAYRAVVVGASAGGMSALGRLLEKLPAYFSPAVIIVQHLMPSEKGYLAEYLDSRCALPVREVEDKEFSEPGHVFIVPANYHLLLEKDEIFCLSVDDRVNYSRPSIDVLFESAARVWTFRLIGIILTGANNDGTRGLGVIKNYGGLTIAQDPATAESPYMPQSAIDAGVVQKIMTLENMVEFLVNVGGSNE